MDNKQSNLKELFLILNSNSHLIAGAIGELIGIVILVSIVFSLLNYAYRHLTGHNADYYYGYVYAFPNMEHSKNYFVKAKIIPEADCDEGIDGSYNCDNSTWISRIYFKNGENLGFDECNGFNKKGKFFECDSEDGDTWNFKYYGEKVKTEEIPTQGQDFN